MKRSDLCEMLLGTDNKLRRRDHHNRCPSWDILDYNMAEPITPSVIIKRYVHET